ncbi:MAG: hypothetical protein FJY97_09750 [candidate division Zixibacteria bacterium]|nr:hypothetical protein [candidate division Zixibacteria bacterium]
MADILESAVRGQLVERHDKLTGALSVFPDNTELLTLLHDVDAALHRLDVHTFGKCAVCGDPVETDRLLANPL